MHVAENRSVRKLVLRPGRNSQQPLEVEVLDADVELAVRVGPFASRPVRVDLDTVSLRVVEIERLAHEVVRRPSQWELLLEGATQHSTELFFRGQQDCEVIEARSARWARTQAGRCSQPQQRLSANSKRGRTRIAGKPGQP